MMADKESRGQILSIEIMLTFSFFLASVMIFMVAWNAISLSYQEEAEERQLESSLIGISDMAVMSQGYPVDWEVGARENASAFGLAISRGILSPQKLSALQSLNSSYDRLREGMGAGSAELYMEVEGEAGRLYEFGRPLPSGPRFHSASAERLAVLEGSLVKVKVHLWRERQ